MPTPQTPTPARASSGRSRETYARTVVADVSVQDGGALRAEARRLLDESVVVISEASDAQGDAPDPQEEIDTSAAAALGWCLEPTLGLWPLIEADAVRLIAIDVNLDEKTAGQIRTRWTVTIKIQDAVTARELALAACPSADIKARAEIERSFAAAWHWAAEPYAPLAQIPGVIYHPAGVNVEQIFARAR